MLSDLILSTAYLPSADYFSLIRNASKVLIEKEENYVRQTPRNRCRIMAANGIITLSVPVTKASGARIPVKDITIDYSKRWQQVHQRAIISSYNRSPYFQFYYDKIENQLLKGHKFLLDLNDNLLQICLEILRITKPVAHTEHFTKTTLNVKDHRFKTKQLSIPGPSAPKYIQVFSNDFISGLSIIDMIFNVGPESGELI